MSPPYSRPAWKDARYEDGLENLLHVLALRAEEEPAEAQRAQRPRSVRGEEAHRGHTSRRVRGLREEGEEMLTACLWFICFLCLGWAATLVWVMFLLDRIGRLKESESCE